MAASLATGSAAAPTGATEIVSVLLGLLVVLALLIALAWLVSRLRGFGGPSAGGPLRVAASAGLGIKERLLLVDAAGVWLLLAVAPGRIEVLHRYESRPDLAPAAAAGFAGLLSGFKRGGNQA